MPELEIHPFSEEHLDGAAALLKERHVRHRAVEPALPQNVDIRGAYVDAAMVRVRMGRGRSEASKKKAGETLRAVVQEHFAELLANRYIGVTLQIDEGQEVFDAKLSSIHPLFARS